MEVHIHFNNYYYLWYLINDNGLYGIQNTLIVLKHFLLDRSKFKSIIICSTTHQLPESRVIWNSSSLGRQTYIFVQDFDSTSKLFQFAHIRGWSDIAIKNGQGDGQCSTCIGYVNDAANAL
jgi:hypothetical protein